MESSPPPQTISSQSSAAARDSASPISDCIVVRDCDSSSVITMDTAITSIATSGNTSKENSRAGSVPTQMEDVISSSPGEVQLAVKLEIATSGEQEHQTLGHLPGQPEIDSVADNESDNNDADLKTIATPQQTRVLRPRPPPVMKTPKSAKKGRQQCKQEKEEKLSKEPSPQLSDVIQIRDPAEIKVKAEEGNRRRSSRLSLLVSDISKIAGNTQTPKRDAGKRSHDIMTAGSKSADAKLGSRSWGKAAQNSSKKIKVKDESSDENSEDSDSSEGDSEEEKGEEKPKLQIPKRKKVWATQGLFVGQGEDFDPRRRTKRGRLSGSGSLPKKPQSILPLPMFQGKAIMENRRDFKLPFNIFSPTPYKVHPPGWKILSRNILVGDARDLWKSETELTGKCTCVPETGCDEHCLNRCVYYECNDENCNVGLERCQNRQFADLKTRVAKKTKFAEGVEVIQTIDRGFGLRATRSFEPNQIIVEYCGEIISQEETESRMKKIYKNNSCYYLMLFDQSMIIDATRGSVARFVNHSCEPNCRMEKWIVDNKPRMALFAGENGVETGEELTYDYNFNWFSGVSQQVCRCGSAKCRGAMGKRTDGRKPPVEVKRAPTKPKRKVNRIRTSITVGSKAMVNQGSTNKKPSRSFKVVKKTVVKKMINKKVIKKTIVKTRGIKPTVGPSKKPIISSMRAPGQRGVRTYGGANRSIKVDESIPKEDTVKVGGAASTTNTSTQVAKRGPGRPRRNPLGNIQTLARAVAEKTGLQGTVLDTIVVVG